MLSDDPDKTSGSGARENPLGGGREKASAGVDGSGPANDGLGPRTNAAGTPTVAASSCRGSSVSTEQGLSPRGRPAERRPRLPRAQSRETLLRSTPGAPASLVPPPLPPLEACHRSRLHEVIGHGELVRKRAPPSGGCYAFFPTPSRNRIINRPHHTKRSSRSRKPLRLISMG